MHALPVMARMDQRLRDHWMCLLHSLAKSGLYRMRLMQEIHASTQHRLVKKIRENRNLSLCWLELVEIHERSHSVNRQ